MATLPRKVAGFSEVPSPEAKHFADHILYLSNKNGIIEVFDRLVRFLQ